MACHWLSAVAVQWLRLQVGCHSGLPVADRSAALRIVIAARGYRSVALQLLEVDHLGLRGRLQVIEGGTEVAEGDLTL